MLRVFTAVVVQDPERCDAPGSGAAAAGQRVHAQGALERPHPAQPAAGAPGRAGTSKVLQAAASGRDQGIVGMGPSCTGLPSRRWGAASTSCPACQPPSAGPTLVLREQAFCDEQGVPQRDSCELKPLERQLCLDRKMRTFYRNNFSHRCRPRTCWRSSAAVGRPAWVTGACWHGGTRLSNVACGHLANRITGRCAVSQGKAGTVS